MRDRWILFDKFLQTYCLSQLSCVNFVEFSATDKIGLALSIVVGREKGEGGDEEVTRCCL